MAARELERDTETAYDREGEWQQESYVEIQRLHTIERENGSKRVAKGYRDCMHKIGRENGSKRVAKGYRDCIR
jgi:hypothetical protein